MQHSYLLNSPINTQEISSEMRDYLTQSRISILPVTKRQTGKVRVRPFNIQYLPFFENLLTVWP